MTIQNIGILVLIAPLALGAAPQSISGPVLGLIPDSGGTAIRPVIGIPGASMLGKPLELDAEIQGAIISPKQDYAIASRATDGQAILIDMAVEPPAVIPVAGARPGAKPIAVSPTGSAAAVYDDSGTVQVLGGLPRNPAVVTEFDISSIKGHAAGLAISDDGSIALVQVQDGDDAGLWSVDSLNGPSRIPLDLSSASAFFPNRHDAAVSDNATHSAFLITDVDHAATLVPLISATDGTARFSSISIAEDGKRVFLADAVSGSITTVDVGTRTSTLTSCACRPTGLYRLSGNSVFRLTEPSGEPIMVLDASADDPRIAIIPPATPAAAQPPRSASAIARSLNTRSASATARSLNK